MQTVLAFLVAISVLIFVHEMGHYWVARRCGVRVLRFSIGFGKPLWRYQRDAGSTEWVIAWIPLGGYVKMLDEREAPVPHAWLAQAFNRKPVAQRMAIVAAGPLVNLLLAVLLYAAVSAIGVREVLPVLGTPPANTPAHEAGVQGGDEVIAIEFDGRRHAVRSWQDLRWQFIRAAEEPSVSLEVRRDGKTRALALRLIPAAADYGDAWFASLGLRLPDVPPLIGRVLPDGAAAAAGLQTGDRVLSVDGAGVDSAAALRSLLRQSADKPLDLTVERAGRELALRVVPRQRDDGGRTIGYIGAEIGGPPPTAVVRLDVIDALAHGMQQTWQMSTLTLKMLGKMLLGQASLKQLSGPLAIADYAGKSAALGLTAYLTFLAVISVSLGVLNLLPIPLLDGGHLLYYSLEAIRGRALPESWELIGQRVGMVLLAALMLVAISNDLFRMLSH